MDERSGYERREADRKMQELHDSVTKLTVLMEKHLEEEAKIKPAIEELISIYKGSKIILPLLAGCVATALAMVAWAKDHIKW